MQPFRRPLGVILFSVLAIVVGVVMSEVAAHAPGNPWWLAMIGGWVAAIAFFVALGALALIAWRLVRRRASASRVAVIAAGVEEGLRRARED